MAVKFNYWNFFNAHGENFVTQNLFIKSFGILQKMILKTSKTIF